MKKITAKQITSLILIIFGFFITLSILSHTFDGDLGWHLRFGQDAWSGNFQYTDNYTWGYLGQNWINHEWGGDLVFWWLYNNFGYFSLNIFIAIFLWAGFLGIGLVFRPIIDKIIEPTRLPRLSEARNDINNHSYSLLPTPYSLIIIALLTFISVKFITITRLAMLGPFFLVWLLWTLERIPKKKTYYWWPIILWLWSFFHGSWILGFIVINIYLFGSFAQKIDGLLKDCWRKKVKKVNKVEEVYNVSEPCTPCEPHKPLYWNWQIIKKIITWQIIPAIVITINPYGYHIWIEVIKYFGNNFYKSHITEWLSSYTYPIFWWPLIIMSFCAVIVYLGWKSKKITVPQLLLFIAFFISGWMYKRNNLFMVLSCIPILNYTWNYIIMSLRKIPRTSGQAPQSRLAHINIDYKRDCFVPRNDRQTSRNNMINIGFGIIVVALIIVTLKPTIHYTNNVWQDNELMTIFGFPYKAVQFLQMTIVTPTNYNNNVTTKQCNNVRVFNTYSWGGYLIWTMPNYLYFADGRSAATWTDKNGQFILQKHLDYLTKPNQLTNLENNGVNYIILQQNSAPYRPPKWYDKILFNDKEIDRAYNLEPAQIYTDLKISPNWTKIYEDKVSIVWQSVIPAKAGI